MQNILLISGHPDLNQSLANKTIIDTVLANRSDIQVRYLDKSCANYRIDVAAEQAALMQADIIIWQFPFYWYSLPGLMKVWLDQVFLHGFAYGSTGNRLKNKKLILSFTIGGSAEAYRYDGEMNYPIPDFLPALRQTALYCGMDYQDPVYSFDMMYLPNFSSETVKNAVIEQAKIHAGKLLDVIDRLYAK
ncbi:NAD(P)H-dependent oxidoreductase [Gallibacterium melopsittaci]|uniref:NAD(P)H-dependent oxidoreductase n=1 Tax=Gallibacterium melopsittaci TaxID=516063 RepID=A0ABV6HUW4_9PAST